MIPVQNWLDQFGSEERDIAEDIAVNSETGRLFSVGYTFGQIEGSEDGTRTPGSGFDVWVGLHDLNGNRLDVARRESQVEGNIPNDFANAVALNPSRGSNGTAYVVGETFGDMTQNSDDNINAGASDVFLLEYTPGRNSLGSPNAIQFGGEGRDFANDVAIDGDGNVYVVGRTENDLGGNSSSGNFDAFVAKFARNDLGGDPEWIELIGSSENDEASAIAIDGTDIYITGETQGNVEGENNGGTDYWLSKINAEDGSEIATIQAGTEADDPAFDLTIDDDDNIILTGDTRGTLGETRIGGQDVWVAKYNFDEEATSFNLDGNFGTRQFGSGTQDFSRGVTTVTENGETTVFLTGYTEGKLNGAINQGSLDAWVVELPGDTGELDPETGTRLIGTSDSDFSRAIASDNGGNLYLAGETAGFLEEVSEEDEDGGDGGDDTDDTDDDTDNGDETDGDNALPQFTSSDTVSVEENATTVTTIEVVDPDGDDEEVNLSISGGTDGEFFELDEETNELRFLEAPDFENPGDANEDNVYEVELNAEDGDGGTNTQDLQVEVLDVDEQDLGSDDPQENIGGLDVWVNRLGNNAPNPGLDDDERPEEPTQITRTNLEDVNDRNLFQNSPVSFDVTYEAIDEEVQVTDTPSELSGLGLRMHFDSSKLEFQSLDNVIDNNDLLFQGEPQEDEEDFDNDEATDQFVNVAWQDINNQWPGEGLNPTRLFTANFTTDLEFSNDTSPINFSASSTANGFNFSGRDGLVAPERYTFDIDGNGETDALTDGVQIIRQLFGIGASEDNIADNATRDFNGDGEINADDMNAYMALGGRGFDVDGSGEATPLTDGIIITRYMFGFRGEDLLAGDILGSDATRTEPEAIVDFIQNYLPESELPQENGDGGNG